jgi:hypothetical protein
MVHGNLMGLAPRWQVGKPLIQALMAPTPARDSHVLGGSTVALGLNRCAFRC